MIKRKIDSNLRLGKQLLQTRSPSNVDEIIQECEAPPSHLLNQESRNEVQKKAAQIKGSESLSTLIQSNALKNTIELCEVFVAIGVHEKTLEKALQEINDDGKHDEMFLDHNCDEISIGRPSKGAFYDSETMIKCNPQILDSYPNILRDESQLEFQPVIKNDPKTAYTINIICFPEGYQVDIEFNRNKLEELCGMQSFNAQCGKQEKNPKAEQGLNFRIIHYTITQSSGDKKYLSSLQYQELSLISFGNTKNPEMKLCIVPKSLQSYQDSDNFQEIEKKLQAAKMQIKFDRMEFYLSTFFHHLRIDGSNLEIEIYKKVSQPENITSTGLDNQQKRTIIRYINTFNKECLKLENYEFRLLFQKVRPKMLLQIFVSLLHERKIILIHNDLSRNAILIEALISLLYPLQWNFTNISYLIPSMVEYLESPIPYIVGVPRELWKYVYENKWDILGEEVVAFDIDNQRVYEKEPLPEFPQPYTQLLIKQLEIQLDKSKQIQIRSVNHKGSFEALREEEKFWNNFTLKVKQQFLNFLIFLINTFENFYINASDSPSKMQTLGVQGTAASTIDSNNLPNQTTHNNFACCNQGSANDIFNFDEYVQNVRENQSFFKQFVRTQAFINFIEQAFYEEQGNLSDASIRFFKECTRKLSKENIQAVRAMQDTMIQGLMHKFNNRGISYSIDKCHLIYEQALRVQQRINTDNGQFQQSKFGLINKLDHKKIIQMTHFDPQYLIEKQYTRGNETIYSIKHLDIQRSNKKPQHYYKDIMQDLQIEEPPNNDYKKTGIPLADYFTVQGTPNGHYKMMIEFNDQEIQLEQLNKTSQLIKIEDNLDEESNSSHAIKDDQRIEEQSNENSSSDQGKDPSLFGFFKKTFSSVKKTFESTFNQNQLRGQSQQRPPSSNQHSLRRQGANTPAIDNPSRLEYDKESSSINNRVTQTKVANRAVRSQTFHVQSTNKVQNQQPDIVQRDRKNNNSFFANLLNLGSNRKNDRNTSADNSLSPNKEEIKNQTLDFRARKRLLNGSGFFVFNEEDMKSMTEMSPKQALKQKTTTEINVAKSQCFQFDNPLMENQYSSRQIPLIKVSTPSQDNNIQSQNLAMRMRSISYQNQSKLPNGFNGNIKPSSKLMNLLNESLNQSQIIEETPQSYSTKEQNVKSNRITFAANTETLMSPMPKYSEQREANITASEHTNMSSQIVFNMNEYQAKGVRSFRQTPIQSNHMSAFKESGTKQASEFEELYKKSTENLFFVPPARNLENGYKEKFNIWKSQSGKVNLSGISGQHTAPPKPPKHQQNPLKKQIAHQIKIESSQKLNKQQLSPKLIKLSSSNFDDKHKLHKSLNSDIYNEKNSTDEESKAPIMGKNLGQFTNIMSIPFDKQSQVKNPSNKSSKTHSVMKSHKRQISSGLQNLKIKGETSLALSSPVLENIEPDDQDIKQNSKQAMQIESMQIGRARKKSTIKNTSSLNKSGNNLKKGISQNYSKQQTTLNQKASNLRPSQVQTKSKVTNVKKPPQHSGQINTKIFIQGSASIKDNILEFAESNINKPSVYKNIKVKTVQSSNQSDITSQQHQYSSCPSKSSLSSSQNESIAAVNSSKIEQKHFRKLDENSMIKQLHEDTSQSIDQSNLNYFSNCSQSEVQNTQSYINAVNSSQIDLRDGKKGDFLRLKSQAIINSPVHSTNMNKFNLSKYTPQGNNHNSQHPQMRMHSLSQYANHPQDTQSAMNQRSQLFSRINSNQQSNMLSRDLKIQTSGSKNFKEQDSSENTLSIMGGPQFNHGPRNNIKPLNKITWDAFSQIAKLSGDVDHEPHTPKSAGVGSDEDID